MPFTYNGIGTHYYGHRNSERRTAACHSCGRGVQLESYDTRLWVVVFFIPVIPLGRKRIIDQCPICKRHYVVDADKWETQKQLNVSGAMEEYLADPTPEKAMAAHQQLMNFHQAAQASEFRREIEEKFRQNARLQAYLGQSLAEKGMPQESAKYFQRALELRPDLPEARVGVAREKMRAGRLDEARALLDFLEKPGAGQLYSLEPIETLANAYQHAGKREEALELFRCLLVALPHIGEIPGFRRQVQACEKVLGRKESILPKWKFSWKNVFRPNAPRPRQPGSIRITWRGVAICAAVAALFVGFLGLHNFYQSHHRRLLIVNGFKDPATVEVQGQKPLEVAGHSEVKLEVPEGRHHVSISRPIHEELDIDMTVAGSPSQPVWLLNVGGAALVMEEEVTYMASNPPPPEISAHFGQSFERIDNISHPFVALPKSIQMSSDEGRRVLSHLELSELPPDQLLSWFQLRGRTGDALRLAEWQLKFHPNDANALEIFVELAPPKHAEEVLHAGLMRRPVEMDWHRAYQNVHTGPDWYGWLRVAYDGMLKDEPASSALLYLRGRVESAPRESTKWFTQARDADPRNAFPYYALGYDRASAGDWEGARKNFAQAVELRPDEPGFADALFYSRLALHEFAPLEKELRAAIAKQPLDFNRKVQLIQLLLDQARPTEAAKIVAAAQQQAHFSEDPGLASVVDSLVWESEYARGDFASMAQSAAKGRTPDARDALFMALLEQGKVADALRVVPLNKPKLSDAYTLITVSVAWLLAHDNEQAQVWLQRALDLLRTGSPDQIRAAALFDKDAVVTPETLEEVHLDWKSKPILLTALGLRRPDQAKELFAAASRLNVDRRFPYHLVRRVAGETP